MSMGNFSFFYSFLTLVVASMVETLRQPQCGILLLYMKRKRVCNTLNLAVFDITYAIWKLDRYISRNEFKTWRETGKNCAVDRHKCR